MIREAVEKSEVIIFDCDGVLMDSNRVKEDAFVKITRQHFGQEAAEFMREFHRKNGGLSRGIKFQAVIDNHAPDQSHMLEDLCQQFEQISLERVINCKLAEDCERVLAALKSQKKRLMVLSGAPSDKLWNVINQRMLSSYFDLLMGSPKTKIQHLIDLHNAGSLKRGLDFVFIGDSQTDLDTSKVFGNCHFFWSEEFAEGHPNVDRSVAAIRRLAELLGEGFE